MTGDDPGGALFEVLNTSSVGEAVFGEIGPTHEPPVSGVGVYGLFDASSGVGYGVFGRSVNGSGVVAETFGGSQPALYARNYTTGPTSGPALQAVGTGGDGIYATSVGNRGVVGVTYATTNQSAAGVFGSLGINGESMTGALGTGTAGVFGTASEKYGYGVVGVGYATFGLVGVNNSTTQSNNLPFYTQAAMYGFSQVGPGLVAFSIGGTTPDGYESDRHSALGGESFEGNGLSVFSLHNVGADIQNSSAYDTLYLSGDYDRTNYAIEVYNRYTMKDAMLLDNHGNLTISGSFVDADGTFVRTRNPNSDRMMYATQSTQATVEDVGSAQLVNGRATVALAADFRETIDGASTYAIFLTPYGDSRGLYVAQRSATGFVVRESQGGRSTMPFDYRIVARPYGADHGRLPHAPGMSRDAIPRAGRSEAARSEVFNARTEILRPRLPQPR